MRTTVDYKILRNITSAIVKGSGMGIAGSTANISTLQALVIDDDPCVLDFVECLLGGLGLRDIQTQRDAGEALKLIEANIKSVDVILCDLHMPNMDGIEFLRHLADSAYKGAVGIISGADARVITAVERLAKTHNLSFIGYVEKHHLDAPLLATLLGQVHQPLEAKSLVQNAAVQEWEIRKAITGGELEVHYQAKVHCDSDKVVGVEALVRWNHAEHGLIKPELFIDAAERFKLIDALTYVVAEQAIETLGDWHKAGLPLNLAINLSAQSLYSLDLPEKLMEYLERVGIDPHYLTLEITESQVLEELSAPMEILTRLCLKGLGLSIDDFGTGYASLEQLNRLPFSELKIDQCFVQQAPQDKSSLIIMESSINMAKRLGMKTVAEGVEDKEMLDLVRSLGCDEVQGYYLAKPMPKELFEEWLNNRNKVEQEA